MEHAQKVKLINLHAYQMSPLRENLYMMFPTKIPKTPQVENVQDSKIYLSHIEDIFK